MSAIKRTEEILVHVDLYHSRPTRMTRAALRTALLAQAHELEEAYAELRKHREVITAVFDREAWDKAEAAR